MDDGTGWPLLFSPLRIRGMELRNRILSTGHQTFLAQDNLPGDDLIAYHAARARGGAGLIVTEAARFHPSSFAPGLDLHIASDAAIPHYARLARAVQGHGARIIGQLSHAGRVSRRMAEGMRGVVWAPSPVPENRFHTVPREMDTDMVAEIIAALAEGARRYAEAGYDGVELMASHGLLFGQFLNPASNRRGDRYGGSAENRLRALREALAAARAAVGPGPVIGLRISADEMDEEGLDQAAMLGICKALSEAGLVDYINTTLGTMAVLGPSVHVVPPMEIAPAYVAGHAARIRAAVAVPVLVAGRINQVQVAEAVLAAGQADMCAMTRALITDPDLPRKAQTGRAGEIRACIGCNQACIGHFHAGLPISCIQNPRTGREHRLPPPTPAARRRKVLIAGAGPAGLRAAVTAAELGHEVILAEAGPQPGGQVLLAQLLPDRAEFGGLVTNLLAELAGHGIAPRLNTPVTPELVARLAPDALILATGSHPVAVPEPEAGAVPVILAEDVLAGRARPGARVVVADWRCDWIGMGTALLLQQRGHAVRLAVNGIAAGQNIQQYVRDLWAGRLHEAGIAVVPYARFFGTDADSAWFIHGASGKPMALDAVDSVVFCAGRAPDTALLAALPADLPRLSIGDCALARSAEEAVHDGLVAVGTFLDGLEAPQEGRPLRRGLPEGGSPRPRG